MAGGIAGGFYKQAQQLVFKEESRPDPTKFDREVVEAIRLYSLCRAMRCLPEGGGLLDQHWKTALQFEMLAGIFQDKEELENKKAQAKMKR